MRTTSYLSQLRFEVANRLVKIHSLSLAKRGFIGFCTAVQQFTPVKDHDMSYCFPYTNLTCIGNSRFISSYAFSPDPDIHTFNYS